MRKQALQAGSTPLEVTKRTDDILKDLTNLVDVSGPGPSRRLVARKLLMVGYPRNEFLSSERKLPPFRLFAYLDNPWHEICDHTPLLSLKCHQ
jgi:hypothetical protein